MLTTVPFSGFYDSLHSSEVDQVIEQMFSDDNCEPNEGLSSSLQNLCNYRQVYVNYAKCYVEAFAEEFKISSLKFDELNSPREYNFTTDRIFAEISLEDADRIRSETSAAGLAKQAHDQFTGRDGFASFYDADVNTWGPLSTWDHNQVGVLLQAYVREQVGAFDEFDIWAEYGLMDAAFSNGNLDNWITEATPGIDRLFKIYNYLQARAARHNSTTQKDAS